jgi:hypothetical protein
VNYQNRPDLVPVDLEAVCVEIKQANSQFLYSFKYFIDHRHQVFIDICSASEVFTKIERLIKSIDDENMKFYILGDLN